MRHVSRWLVASLLALSVIGVGAIAGADVPAKKGGGKLVGVFKIEAADCAAGAVTSGSYFQMVQPAGTVDAGPYLANGDSSCGDKNFTGLVPGTDGGLITGKYQPQPDPPMDPAGNGLAAKIIQPTKFFALNFAMSTNKADPQTGVSVPAPTIKAGKGGALSGDLKAISVAYGGQQFSQGAPKPDGTRPGNTTDLTGTYDKKTGAFTMDWASQIVGGPFDTFTGVWHLEGTFKKK
jgi:hypothetical protein